MKKTQKKIKESTSTQVDHSQFINSDGYAQAVDVEVSNPQETQIVQVGGQRAMLPEKKRKAKWY